MWQKTHRKLLPSSTAFPLKDASVWAIGSSRWKSGYKSGTYCLRAYNLPSPVQENLDMRLNTHTFHNRYLGNHRGQPFKITMVLQVKPGQRQPDGQTVALNTLWLRVFSCWGFGLTKTFTLASFLHIQTINQALGLWTFFPLFGATTNPSGIPRASVSTLLFQLFICHRLFPPWCGGSEWMSQNIWVTEPHQTQAVAYCTTNTHAFMYTISLAEVCLDFPVTLHPESK